MLFGAHAPSAKLSQSGKSRVSDVRAPGGRPIRYGKANDMTTVVSKGRAGERTLSDGPSSRSERNAGKPAGKTVGRCQVTPAGYSVRLRGYGREASGELAERRDVDRVSLLFEVGKESLV